MGKEKKRTLMFVVSPDCCGDAFGRVSGICRQKTKETVRQKISGEKPRKK